MDVEDVTREFYSRLFFLPSLPKLVGIYVVILVAIGLINSYPPGTPRSILISIEQYFILGLMLVAVFLFLSVTKVFTFKRIVGLSMAMFVASTPAELIFYRLTGFKGTGLLAGTGLVYTFLSALYGMVVSIALATVPPFLAFYIVNEVVMGRSLPSSVFLGALITELISLLAGILYLSYFEASGRLAFGCSPMRMIRAFLRTWFTGDPKALEDAFEENAVTSDLKVRTLVLWREGGEPVALVFPTLHYGLFRDVGSARFIYHLEEVLEPKVRVLTFHTAGSHEHNLVSSEDSRRVARLVGDALLEQMVRGSERLRLCRPFRARVEGGWEAFVVNGPTALAMIVVNKEVGNDDLTSKLWDRVVRDPRAPIFTAIADSHSFKGDRVDYVETLEPLVSEVFRRYSCLEGEEFLAGFAEATLDAPCRCVCSPKVKALTLNFGGDRYALVYIYGNNMEGGYRLKLESLVKSMGFKDAEIVTPDDHSCAASFKEAPYDVVSENPALTKAVLEAVREASSNELRATYSTYDVIVRGVKFVGDLIFKLTDQLGKFGKRAERLVIPLVLVSNAAPIVIYTLILSQPH